MSHIIRKGFASEKTVVSFVPFLSENSALKDHYLLTLTDGTTEVMSSGELAAYGISPEAQVKPVEAPAEEASPAEEPLAPSESEVAPAEPVIES